MDGQIVAIYALSDDLLRALGHQEDKQCQMRDAEVMTTALVAALFYGGNYELARWHLHEQGYMRRMLSKSRFNRRLHRIKEHLLTLFAWLGEVWKALNAESWYAIDSFPVVALDNYRICRSRLYQGPQYRGYQASKQRYFYGLKLHLMVTAGGQPVEFFLTPASTSDVTGLQEFDFDLPPGTTIYADRAYTDYEMEDVLAEAELYLSAMRKTNSRRPVPPWVASLQHLRRKVIETTGARLTARFPKTIHAVTQEGFELKVVLFVMACSLDFLF